MALLQKKFMIMGIKFSNGIRSVVMINAQSGNPVEVENLPLTQKKVYLKAECDFTDRRNIASSYYRPGGRTWRSIGNRLRMEYSMPHFMGYHYGLFYSTKNPGRFVDFDWCHISNNRTGSN